MNTIATISTPLASGAIGIVRMSGKRALEIADGMFRCTSLKRFEDAEPYRMYYGTVTTRTVRDNVLAVYFRAPRSYTGEDVVEFQCHGGMRLVQEILRECLSRGARIADKGEFTKRAFLNGKMQLSDAEGVIDMIHGESVAAINAGYRLAGGNVAQAVQTYADQLLDCIGELEASLDYPDEMEDESRTNAVVAIEGLMRALQELSESAAVGGMIKNGIAVALVGQANVGKSSLLNRLLGTERAIVTDIAGTTRDSLEECIEADGILLRLIDTAGIRETRDTVEKLGVERSLAIAQSSDIVLFLTDASKPISLEESQLYDRLTRDGNRKVLKVCNKCDLGVHPSNLDGIAISAKTNEGIDDLKRDIVRTAVGEKIDPSGTLITNERHAQAIVRAINALRSARSAWETQPTECTLLDLREAYFALGEITGQSATEDIIDRIFSKFCLGK